MKFTATMLSLLLAQAGFAVRPFITDDARVVGRRLAQWESWTRFDRFASESWHMAAYGPSDKWELALGGVFGRVRAHDNIQQHFSYGMPLIQAKYLITPYRPNHGPGLGLVAGSFLPGGRGELKAEGQGAFAFFTATQCFGDDEEILIHANVGASTNSIHGNQLTWGLGTQVKTYGGFHLVGEVFYGDPYVPGVGVSYQVGFRHFVSDQVQIDGTYGRGISGINTLDPWLSFGVRLVGPELKSKRKSS